MVNLNGHEAGNGGYSQGTPTARRAFLYSELFSQKQDFRAEGGMRTDSQTEETKSLARQIENEVKELSA
jgi:hypothetical protein